MAPKGKRLELNTYTNLVGYLNDFFKSFEVSIDNNSWVDLFGNETFNSSEDFTGKDDDRCGTISDFLVLSSSEFDHRFGSWMLDIDLKKRNLG